MFRPSVETYLVTLKVTTFYKSSKSVDFFQSTYFKSRQVIKGWIQRHVGLNKKASKVIKTPFDGNYLNYFILIYIVIYSCFNEC